MPTIRLATAADLPALHELVETTFLTAFGPPVNTPANMEKYRAEYLTLARIGGELAHPDSRFFLVEKAGQLVGYLKLNQGAAQAEQLLDHALEIERIYVRAAWQGQQIGQLLCDFALATARTEGFRLIWLGVWEENRRAIRFYERNGFQIFSHHFFWLGDDRQKDYLLKREL